jgi:hypothetical protein
MDVRDLLLTTAFRHRINEPNIEAGFERFVALARFPSTLHHRSRHGPARPGHPRQHDGENHGPVEPGHDGNGLEPDSTRPDPASTDHVITFDAFCDAVATCLRDGLIREPIRLPEGALQCHWHLELTPKGVAAARELLRLCDNKHSVQDSRTLG